MLFLREAQAQGALQRHPVVKAEAGDERGGYEGGIGVHRRVQAEADSHEQQRNGGAAREGQAAHKGGDEHQGEAGDLANAGQPQDLTATQPEDVNEEVRVGARGQSLAQARQKHGGSQKDQVLGPYPGARFCPMA